MRVSMAAIVAAGSLGLLMTAVTSGSVQAAQVFNFSGTCIDCTGNGLGSLVLSDTAGGTLNKNDFVSFSYKSNLLSFNLSHNDIVAVTGSLTPNDLGRTYIDIIQMGGTGWEFTRNADGSWSVSSKFSLGEGANASGGGGGGYFGGGGGGGGGGGASQGSTASSGLSGFQVSNDPGRIINDFGAVSNISEAVIAAVPEPASWALMLLGFGGLGATLRSRRRSLRTA